MTKGRHNLYWYNITPKKRVHHHFIWTQRIRHVNLFIEKDASGWCCDRHQYASWHSNLKYPAVFASKLTNRYSNPYTIFRYGYGTRDLTIYSKVSPGNWPVHSFTLKANGVKFHFTTVCSHGLKWLTVNTRLSSLKPQAPFSPLSIAWLGFTEDDMMWKSQFVRKVSRRLTNFPTATNR